MLCPGDGCFDCEVNSSNCCSECKCFKAAKIYSCDRSECQIAGIHTNNCYNYVKIGCDGLLCGPITGHATPGCQYFGNPNDVTCWRNVCKELGRHHFTICQYQSIVTHHYYPMYINTEPCCYEMTFFEILCGNENCENENRHISPCELSENKWLNWVIHDSCYLKECCECCKCEYCNHSSDCNCAGTHCLYHPHDLLFIAELFSILFGYLRDLLDLLERFPYLIYMIETINELTWSQIFILEAILDAIKDIFYKLENPEPTDLNPIILILQDILDALQNLKVEVTIDGYEQDPDNELDPRNRVPFWQRILDLLLNILTWIIELLMTIIEFIIMMIRGLWEAIIQPLFAWLIKALFSFIDLMGEDSPISRWHRNEEDWWNWLPVKEVI